MAIVRTVIMRLDSEVEAGVNVDDVVQEAVSVFFRNDSGRMVRLWFRWKNNQEYELISADPGEVVQPIPPGQRRWVVVPDDEMSDGIDSDFARYTLGYV